MSDKDKQTVLFTQKQYDYLNRMFPEQASANMTTEALRFYSGQRSMVMFVGTRVQKDEQR